MDEHLFPELLAAPVGMDRKRRDVGILEDHPDAAVGDDLAGPSGAEAPGGATRPTK